MSTLRKQASLIRRGVWALACTVAVLPALGMAQSLNEYTVARFVGAEGGDWGGQNNAVVGIPDGVCANMGALDKLNLVSAFNYAPAIVANSTPIAATAFIKAASKGGQIVHIRLAKDVTDILTAGNEKNLDTANVSTGNCAQTTFTQIPIPVNEPGDIDTFWGLGGLTSGEVESANFGMVLEKAIKSEVKVDAICIEVTFSTTESGGFSNSYCDTPPPAGLTLQKNVTNNNSGSAVPADWNQKLVATPSGGGSDVLFDHQETIVLDPGSYDLTELAVAGYSPASPTALSCTGDGTFNGAADPPTITLAQGESAVCTFFNDDNPPNTATLTLVKDVTNNFDGASVPGDWELRAEGLTGLADRSGATGVTDQTVELSNGTGDYTLSEACFETECEAGYVLDDISCNGGTLVGDVLTLGTDDDVTCTFYNQDLEPPKPDLPIPVNSWWMQILLVLLLIGTAWYARGLRAGRS